MAASTLDLPLDRPEDDQPSVSGASATRGVEHIGGGVRMGEATHIDITAGARGVRITLHERMWTMSPDPWDQAAVSATVTLQDGTWQTQCDVVLWSHELVALRRSLDAVLHHGGSFTPREWVALDGTLVLVLGVPGRSKANLTVAVRDSDRGVAMQMEMTATRADLVLLRAQIDAALERYPP